MSNKKIENKPNLRNQASISKYFKTDSQYPTSLGKRNAAPEKTSHLHPKKAQKLHTAERTECIQKTQISECTSKRLQSFNFNKINLRHDLSENSTILNHGTTSVEQNISISNFDSLHNKPLSFSVTMGTSDEKELHVKQIPESSLTDGNNKTQKYTPLEKQYLEFKNKYPDAILLIECGYKYRFFGEDAEIASKVLNIACFKNNNFMSAIIPVPRLHFHVQRLIMKGYKVGVVKQIETAALKAVGEKRNELFSRELSALYTSSTLIGEAVSPVTVWQTRNISRNKMSKYYESAACHAEIFPNCVQFVAASISSNTENSTETYLDMGSGYLVCVNEEPSSNNKSFNIALVGIHVSSGDLTYAIFEDVALRTKLETCLVHINPSEILLPSNLSNETKKLLNSFKHDRSVRTEIISPHVFDHLYALDNVSEFYQLKNSSQKPSNSQDMEIILSLPALVISCLSALKTYLSQFKLESILKNLGNLKPLSTVEHMILSAATLKGLEIFENNSNHSVHDSLFWVLNRTVTKFGERLMKFWIGKPLKDLNMIEERLNIVTEIVHSESIVFKILRSILNNLPDLERILCCVFYNKCSSFDFLKLLQAFTKIQTELLSVADKVLNEVEVPRIKIMLTDLPELLKDVYSFLKNIDPESAKEGDKTKVFIDTSMYPDMKKCQEEILNLQVKLNDLKPEICKIFGLHNFKYTTVAGQKYLIEVPNKQLCLVPNNWLKISSTKHISRFRSPEIIKLYNKIQQQKELMIGHANVAWITFLNEFNAGFCKYKRAVSHLAELDCYLGLAKIAKEENYCRPYFADGKENYFCVHQGRHPMLTKSLGEEKQFVANDINMNSTIRCVIVTGPNMGGKSTYVRQTALIAVMAQIGSYVPADSATLPVFDSICVRMGGDDDLVLGKSTFMTEMSETSEILANISAKSFVILDELGRGTSTNDGTAIAYATLKFLISEVQCFTMFVTHYPAIIELKNHYPENVSTVHMGFFLKDNNDGNDIESVVFLYNVVNGVSERSYGINVAALAGISKQILCEAEQKSRAIELKGLIQRKLKEMKISFTVAK